MRHVIELQLSPGEPTSTLAVQVSRPSRTGRQIDKSDQGSQLAFRQTQLAINNRVVL